MGTSYLTDGTHLYEIVDQRTVQNYGLRRGTITYTIIRDVVSEAVARIDDLYLAALSEVAVDGLISPGESRGDSSRDRDRDRDVDNV
jgi:hypothetical protein